MQPSLSRLMIATPQVWENYGMKANSKEGHTRFYLQKIVVNNYALSILVIRYQTHLLKDNDLDRITESHHD
jgi:hypothetical protein